jgi:glucans biosynthesis protein C
VILVPLLICRSGSEKSLLHRFSAFFDAPWQLLLLILPLYGINVVIDVLGLGVLRSPGGWDFFSYLFLLAYGYLAASNPIILGIIRRHRRLELFLALLLSVSWLVIWFGIQPEVSEETPILYLFLMLIRSTQVLMWLGAILGYGQVYLTHKNRFLTYAAEATLPFYILHQTVLLVIGYPVVQWQIPDLLKYLIIAAAALIIIMLLYEFLIRRVNLFRRLFGLKTATQR